MFCLKITATGFAENPLPVVQLHAIVEKIRRDKHVFYTPQKDEEGDEIGTEFFIEMDRDDDNQLPMWDPAQNKYVLSDFIDWSLLIYSQSSDLIQMFESKIQKENKKLPFSKRMTIESSYKDYADPEFQEGLTFFYVGEPTPHRPPTKRTRTQ